MKKTIKSLLAIAVAAFAFTACSDVPEPYQIPGSSSGGGDTPEGTYVSESFETSFGSFTVKTIKGTPWVIDFKTAKATGYDGSATTASEAYLVSSPIDLSQSKGAYLEFDYILRYVKAGQTENKVFATSNYTGDPTTTKWTDITGTLTEGKDWTTFAKYQTNLPAEMIGQSAVVLAMYYSCTTSSSTIEIKNLKVIEGSAGGGQGGGESGKYGTKDNPINVAKALEVINGLADNGSTDEEAFVKGTVVSVGYYDSAKKLLSYWISDDGTATSQIQVYNGKNLDGSDFNAKTDLNVGAIVTVKGRLKKYVKASDSSVTPESDGGVIVAIENNGGNPEPTTVIGSLTEPITVADALTRINALADGATTAEKAYVKGFITKISETDYPGNSYGNASYEIADTKGGTTTLTVFRGYNLGNKKFTKADDIKVGDEVIVFGNLQKYVKNGTTTPEVAKDNYIVSLNGTVDEGGESGGESGGGQGGGGESGGGEVSGNTITVAASSFGLENASELSTLNLTDGTKLTFDAGGNKTTPKYYAAGSGSIRMYPNNQFTINAGSKKITAIELICDEYQETLYNASGNITVDGATKSVEGASLKYTGLNASTAVVKNTAEGSGAATQLRLVTLKITYAE